MLAVRFYRKTKKKQAHPCSSTVPNIVADFVVLDGWFSSASLRTLGGWTNLDYRLRSRSRAGPARE